MAQLVLPLVRHDRPRRARASLPHAADGPSGRAEPGVEPIARRAAGPGGPPRFVILIVDDDPLMTEMLPRRLLRALPEGVEIVTARAPEDAAEVMRARRPDAVLSDYNLRHIQTGLDVLRAASEEVPRAARILFSGHSAGEIAGLRDASIHAFLEKPLRLDDLVGPVLDEIERATGARLRGGDALG